MQSSGHIVNTQQREGNPQTSGKFSLTQARSIVQDLFQPDARIYWTDFLLSISLGHLAASAVRFLPNLWEGTLGARWALQGLFFIASCLFYYRAALFIHELTHLPRQGFRAFRIGWNVLCGIPFLMPSFVYYTHVDHHRRKHFGTHQDGEYLSFGRRPPILILLYLAQSFIIPILAVVRFLILSPMMWVFPPLRKWIHQHASSLVIDPTYVRPLPGKKTLRMIRLQEALCFLWLVGVIAGSQILFDRWPIYLSLQAYPTAVVIVFLNAMRTVVAHRYSGDGREVSFEEQMLDSTNFPRRPWLSELWAPVGLRFHALHHVFPSMPYHNLAKGHQRLMAQLPADSSYRQTEQSSFMATLVDLWRRSAKHGKQHDAAPQRGDLKKQQRARGYVKV